MSRLFYLTPDEEVAVAAALNALSERTKPVNSLDELLERWRGIVVEIERGYRLSIYDYIDDLITRDLLQEIMLQLPESLSGRLSKELRPLDNQYFESTMEIQHPLSPGKHWLLGPSWFRVPKNLGGELQDDFRSFGFLK